MPRVPSQNPLLDRAGLWHPRRVITLAHYWHDVNKAGTGQLGAGLWECNADQPVGRAPGSGDQSSASPAYTNFTALAAVDMNRRATIDRQQEFVIDGLAGCE
ncbi:hypothetical protein ACQP2U_25510 [Nocardia sp. CA-084685]|uniref:hypothetical protein n=1 Tax=Nocardia sp. CA-084685 TaxID=3239970 RepID=UPI003D95C319